MFTLVLLTFCAFVVLWIGDFHITIKTVREKGPELELNPLTKILFRVRGRFIWLFKIIEIGIFVYLLYFLTTFSGVIPFYILLIYILFYSIIVANNSRIYYKITGKESTALRFIFMALTVFLTLFIYLNYMLYSNLTLSYNALMAYHSAYNNLYWICQQQNATAGVTLPQDILGVLESINLTIPRGF